MRVLLMILIGVVLLVFGVAMVWYLVVRGSKAATISEDEFDDAYAALVADGTLVDRGNDRAAAWHDFNAWQLTNERERASSDEWTDE
jgi:hypothetical protein